MTGYQNSLVYEFLVVPVSRSALSTHKAQSKVAMEGTNTENLEEKLTHLLTFGKIIGAFPTRTVLGRFRVIRIIPYILGIVALVDLIGVIIFNPRRSRTATELAGDFGVPGFYSLGTFLYFQIQRSFQQLDEIFAKWKQLEIKLPDFTLKRFVNLTSFCILTSAILENATFHFKLFPVFEPRGPLSQNISSLEVFYQRSHSHWALYLPYNPVIAVLLFITNKWTLYIWNFADVLIAVLSRALHFRLHSILKYHETVNWENVWFEFIQLMDITQQIEIFLSPVIFACYTMNMYALCMQLHMWLSPSESKHILHTLYLAWSFVHLLARILVVSISAAKLYEEIQQFERKVQYCPNEKYSVEIERLEFYTKSPKRGLGFTGLGCFVITKPFILSLFSVAFTFEVFLLQSDNIKLS